MAAERVMVVIDVDRFIVERGPWSFRRVAAGEWTIAGAGDGADLSVALGWFEGDEHGTALTAWLDSVYDAHYPPVLGVCRERHLYIGPLGPDLWAAPLVSHPSDNREETSAHGSPRVQIDGLRIGAGS